MAEPATYGRMAGRYFSQCPTCRTGHVKGPDCAGSGPVLARIQRQTDKRQLRRYLDQTPEVYSWYRGLIISSFDPYDVFENDEQDCRHGCNGHCERWGGQDNPCTFICHPPWPELE